MLSLTPAMHIKAYSIPSHQMPCWLCENHSHPEAVQMQEFILKCSHTVDPEAMAKSIERHLCDKLPDGEQGPVAAEVLIHLQRHMLQPQVRISHLLRNMVDLSENIREVVSTRAEDDSPLVDVRAASLYIKAVSEVMMLYRSTDPSKLLFGS